MASKPRNLSSQFCYHIYNRSLQEREKIFSSNREYQRFLGLIAYYQLPRSVSYAQFEQLPPSRQILDLRGLEKRVKILAYVIMPNHFHFLLRPTENPQDLSRYISDIANSYARYFNLKNGRHGPLFQGKFKSKEISNEQSLLQVSRYIHLNPLLSEKANPEGKIKNPQEWAFSSYHEWAGFKNPHIVDGEEVSQWTEKVGGSSGYREFVEAKLKQNPAGGIEDLIIEPSP